MVDDGVEMESVTASLLGAGSVLGSSSGMASVLGTGSVL